MPTDRHPCQACGGSLHEISGFARLPRVTSDSKPYKPGGRLFVCEGCGLAQKIADKTWLVEIGEIYRDYDMYHQSAANDQAVFDPVSGRPSARCEVLSKRLLESGALARSGRLLDVGAGSGAMLGAFSKTCSTWKLFGLDLDDRKERALKAIPGFERLYTGPAENLAESFDLVSLIHSLEHFTAPLDMLKTLRRTIGPGGRLFVQVNNAEKTAFDLVVADHLCHFTPRTLEFMVDRSGLHVESARTDWVNKEISLLACQDGVAREATGENPRDAIARTERDVAWLNGMLDDARRLARGNDFGIFGTSVAATWLAADLRDAIRFFVDEDPAREGRTHLDRPILKPDQVPAGATVYLAFVPQVSDSIKRRLARLPVKFAGPHAEHA